MATTNRNKPFYENTIGGKLLGAGTLSGFISEAVSHAAYATLGVSFLCFLRFFSLARITVLCVLIPSIFRWGTVWFVWLL